MPNYTLLPEPVVCDNCGSDNLRFSLNSHDRPIWKCNKCSSSVGCADGTRNPLGYLAPPYIKEKRKALHSVFDSIWKKHYMMPRADAYNWLALKLGIEKTKCHVAMLTEPQLDDSIILCRKLIKDWPKAKHRRTDETNAELVRNRKQRIKRIRSKRP